MQIATPAPVRAFAGLVVCAMIAGCAALPQGLTGTKSAMPAKGKFINTLTAADTYRPARVRSAGFILRRPLTAPTGLVQDPALVAYSRRILDRLLASWPYQRPDVQILVVPSPSFRSDTTPEGAIIISTGLLHYFVTRPANDNDDRFAFVLAHELSHVLMGQTTSRASVVTAASQLRGVVYMGASFALGAKAAEVANITRNVVIGTYLFGVAANHAMFPAWQRVQESEADLLAIDLMAAAGYNLQGATDVLTILVAQERKAALAEPAIEPWRHYLSVQNSGGNEQFHFDFKHWMTPYLLRARRAIEASHPAAEARLNTAEVYIARQYSTYLPPMSSAGFARITNAPPTRLMIAEQGKLGDAAVSLIQRQPRPALYQLASVHSAVLRDSEYYLYLEAMTDFDAGRTAAATNYFDAAERQSLVTQPVLVLHAQILLNQHHPNAALAAYTAADRKFGTEAYLPQRIAIEKSEKHNLAALVLMERCNGSGNIRLINECAHADQ